MFNIGLTGSIGAGKSTVSSYLKKRGYIVLDADQIVHNLYEQNSFCEMLGKEFGREFLDEEGFIDRRRLSRAVFEDEVMRRRLNDLVHPLVIHRLFEEASRFKEEKVIYDVPLLFETKMDLYMDAIIVIVSEEELSKKRVQLRDNRSRQEVDKIFDRQIAQEIKIQKADFVIFNDSSLEELFQKVDEVLPKLERFLKNMKEKKEEQK
ncbi:MAG: dephospho-CoA kinase [Filifactor alocis]|nr:dephospho-CoA kinase [Filifactor alocis]